MSTLARSPRELRDELEASIRADLVGPLNGDREELRDRPIDRYLLGLLSPQRTAPSGDAAAQTSPAADDDDAEDPAAADRLPEDELATGDVAADSGEEGTVEDRPAAVEQLVPSAFGLTFAVGRDCTELEVDAEWGAYSSVTSETMVDHQDRPARVWQRRPCGGRQTVQLPQAGTMAAWAPDADEPEVVVRGLVRDRGEQRLVSLFLVNGQVMDAGSQSTRLWLCQAQLTVTAPGGRPVFVRRDLDAAARAPEVDKREIAGLELLHRNAVELAVGHGVAVEATCATDDPARGTRLRTAALPAAEVPLTDPPTPEDFADDEHIAEPYRRVVLDMQRLAEADGAELPQLLAPLADAYEAWIDAQARRLDAPDAHRLAGHEEAAREHLSGARDAARRIRAGIDALADPEVAAAFTFANHVMWQQRVHTLAAEDRRRDDRLRLADAVNARDEERNRSWRPFQLAFVLTCLPSLADPTHDERTGAEQQRLVDLLFFPTGGGKTEAYLGLTAFTLAIRRLQGERFGRPGEDGVAVLMRYTLRLLTLQQFQRAAALLCACELRRRALYARGDERWGRTPMRIGLWVGQASTPNRIDDADEWVKQARRRSGSARGSSPLQLARCPWCGSELRGDRDVRVDMTRRRVFVDCSDTRGECPFVQRSSPDGLPILVVDEEIYTQLPSLVIATIDKFARMPWEGRVQALFGQVSRRCERHGYLTPSTDHEAQSHPARGASPKAAVVPCGPLRPPDLVIQDELHLISGPLGSLAGLYETAVDALSGWTVDGAVVRPKVIASTATIRRAHDQVARLFDRRLAVFPPPGLDARDSFFALQRDQPQERDARPGRRYLGICAPGRRYKQVLIRAYVAQLRAAWDLLGRQPGPAADAYMTLVGYFNSLREVGGMRRLVEDDVQNRLFQADRDRPDGRGRLYLEELTSRRSAADIPQVLDRLASRRLSTAKRQRGDDAIDVLLATNMISVGVDVPRLGAMVVAGQPKSTSEYIQATSRIGRAHPGLVLTAYNWARPRDLSHYETFGHYHATLYRQVEALSVTPFAPRALDRGLTGVLASLLRLSGAEWNANGGAAEVDPAKPRALRAQQAISDRAHFAPAARDALEQRLAITLDHWRGQAQLGQRNLVYRAQGKSDADVGLLREPRAEAWSDWTVPTSLRNVEAPVPLALRERGIGPPPEDWQSPERAATPPKDDG